MPNILVASTNPVKVQAAKQAFESMFPGEVFAVSGRSVSSGVSDQPMTDAETLLGASNRLHSLKGTSDADYYVAIEGGIELVDGEMHCFAWALIENRDGKTGKGRTGVFFLPKELTDLIASGHELGKAADILFHEENSKQKSSTVGLLTSGVIDRTAYYHHAFVLALIPFKNPGFRF